ncbi:MAG: FecR domain-containing protein [Phycisphaeraceae bacterium]
MKDTRRGHHDEAGRLISAYLDGVIDEPGVTRLRELLKQDPALLVELSRVTQLEEHARLLLSEQAAASDKTDSLLSALSALSAGEEDARLVTLDLPDRRPDRRPDKKQTPRRRAPRPVATDYADRRIIIIPRSLAYAAALAVVAGVVIGLVNLFAGDEPPPRRAALEPTPVPPAQVLRSRGAVWSGATPEANGAMPPGRYRLSRGFAELSFADGTRVTLQGPSSFEVVSGSELSLQTGMAKANVPDGAEGFTIVSPAGRFVDLGTVFGVDVSGAGKAELHVFDGLVDAYTRAAQGAQATRVKGGEAVALDASRPSAMRLAFRPEKFADSWDQTRDGVETTDSIRYLFTSPESVQAHRLEHDDQAFMFKERQGVRLDRALPVSFAEPGRYVRFGKPPHAIAADARVDSYFVHFDRVGIAEHNDLEPIGGSITFDRPVVGIIVNDALLDASDPIFQRPGTRYPGQHTDRGLEYRPRDPAHYSDLSRFQDSVVLSDDRRTVILHLETSSNIDQLRIIVQSEPASVPD